MRGEQRPRSGLVWSVSSTGPVVLSNNRCQPVTRSNHFLCVIFSWPTTHTFARLPLSTTTYIHIFSHSVSVRLPVFSIGRVSTSTWSWPSHSGTRSAPCKSCSNLFGYLLICRSTFVAILWHSITVSWPRSFFAAAKIFCLSNSLHLVMFIY